VAVGVDGLFMEVHPHPEAALCDGPNSQPLNGLRPLLEQLSALDQMVKEDKTQDA
jgi:2-dehydro-3-deoxyphosphooctonate aldolase (KDO 8-P synthase)